MSKLYTDYAEFPIRYANCWEDSDNLLRTAPENARILSICSGGDNTLALLLKNPREVVAFDMNIYQIYLLQLKVAAIKNLSYDEVLILLGIHAGDACKIFKKLKSKLAPEAYKFFNNHPEFFEKGLINTGKFEHYFQLFARKVCPLFASRKTLQKFAVMDDIDAQKTLYETRINNRRLKIIFGIFFGFKAMGKFGRDKNYYNHISETNKKNNARDIKERFDAGVTSISNNTNPYLQYVLLNRFNDDCLPDYLKPENYQKIKKNLSKIAYLCGPLMDVTGKYDYLNLSDIFEYMDEEDFAKNIDHLTKIAKPGAVVAYYNMQNMRYLDDKTSDFKKMKRESAEGFKKNRAYFYRDFLVYKKAKHE